MRDPVLRLRIGPEAVIDVRSRWLHGSILTKMQNAYTEAIVGENCSFQNYLS